MLWLWNRRIQYTMGGRGGKFKLLRCHSNRLNIDIFQWLKQIYDLHQLNKLSTWSKQDQNILHNCNDKVDIQLVDQPADSAYIYTHKTD